VRIIIYSYLFLLTIILPISISAGNSFFQEEEGVDITQLLSEEETEDGDTYELKAFHEEFFVLTDSHDVLLELNSGKSNFKGTYNLLSGVASVLINPPELS